MMRCLIVDDEQAAIDILVHYMEQTHDMKVVGTATNPMEALRLVHTENVDLVFLDIQMPELSGMDFIKALGGKALVVLTTAYSEFALESYELDVVDYLLKPIRFTRFIQATQKAWKELDLIKGAQGEPPAAVEYFFFKTESKGKLVKVDFEHIDYIEGMKNYVAVYHSGQKTMVHSTMKELEARLPRNGFMRVHKSFIVPLAKIIGIDGNRVQLKGVRHSIPIGESYKGGLLELIKNRLIQ